MKLTLSLIVWTLIALVALFVLGPDTSRELPKPKPPPSQPKDHASVPVTGDTNVLFVAGIEAVAGNEAVADVGADAILVTAS